MRTLLGNVEISVQVRSASDKVGYNYADSDNFNAKPEVTLTGSSGGIYVGKFLVTNEQYALHMAANPGVRTPDYWADTDFNGSKQPVVGITWAEAKAFATWIGGRLLSEAEFEQVASSQLWKDYPDSYKSIGSFAWYRSNTSNKTREVGAKSARSVSSSFNAFWDQLGNVWEWVEDDYHDSHTGCPLDGSAWVDGPRSLYRVIKGGSYKSDDRLCRPWSRDKVLATGKASDIGFRVVALPGSF